ncbi:hypothetical protein OQ968_20215 [Mycobacterium sp. 663a-19]|uniref:hypothetical protein n=1 Tax=Mycobacterium sp. 663a-19 TaxID=2986148 RepID=UPI002D1EEEF1|nr:hypothetical protein [Mycobacterium sp. 663a-19]MEB3983580.1 hypothetical protein [Mycobacterium sp. 663a-19]
MSAVTCAICGGGFSARSDAVYCSSACRQKAHRARTARRIADLRAGVDAGPRTGPSATGKALQRSAAGTIQRARDQVRRSRELCRLAAERLQQAAAVQQQFGRATADAQFPAARPGDVSWRGNLTVKP